MGLCLAFLTHSLSPTHTQAYTNARWIGWVAITTTMLTFLPLFIETAREAEMEAMEQASIEEGLARGETPFEMAQGKGLQGAVDPDVISKA